MLLSSASYFAIETTYKPSAYVGSAAITYSNSNDASVNVDLTGITDDELRAGVTIPVYIKSEDGSQVMTYFVKVSSVEGNPELKSVDVVVDGVVSCFDCNC